MDLPRVRCSRVSWSVSTCSAADDAGAARRAAPAPSTAESRTLPGSTAGVSVVPMKASTSAKALSDSGPAWAGSPQRDQCISGGELMCYSVTHDVHSSQPRERRRSRRRLPRRRPRGDPRRRLEPYDAHRHRPPGRSQPDDALPPVARHPDAARRPDDPRVGRVVGQAWAPPTTPTPSTGSRAASSRPSRHCATTRCCAASSTSTPRCCSPTCSTAVAAARRWSPTRSPALIAQGQREKSIRRGDPVVLARSLVLAVPRVHPLGAHHVRPRTTRRPGRRRQPSRQRARSARAEVPRPMTTRTGRINVGLADIPESTDVLVIGLGITGAGRRARRRQPGPVGGGRRRPRRRLRHQPLELQAGARRAALPRPRPGRRRPRERRRARHPDADARRPT